MPEGCNLLEDCVNMNMIRFVLASGLAAGLLIAAPAFAQVYKWVDSRGVVNYSNEAPANRNSTLLDPKSVRVSTYSTDAPRSDQGTLTTARDPVVSEKIDRLERDLEVERYARSLSETQAQAAADSWYQQCLRDRRVDCDYAGADPYYDYGPYYGAVAVTRPRLRPRPVARPNVAAPRAPGRPATSTMRSAAPRQM